jgi:hypothetical protein
VDCGDDDGVGDLDGDAWLGTIGGSSARELCLRLGDATRTDHVRVDWLDGEVADLGPAVAGSVVVERWERVGS